MPMEQYHERAGKAEEFVQGEGQRESSRREATAVKEDEWYDEQDREDVESQLS